mgnify:FL=1
MIQCSMHQSNPYVLSQGQTWTFLSKMNQGRGWLSFLTKFCPGYCSKLYSSYGNVIGHCHCVFAYVKLQSASIDAYTNLGPKIHPTKPFINQFWAVSTTHLSYWNFKIAILNLEILEEREIMSTCTISISLSLCWDCLCHTPFPCESGSRLDSTISNNI